MSRGNTQTLACTDDPSLIAEAEALLNQDTTALEHFAELAATTLRDDLPTRVGERLGSYAITREIGRGGMGAVYLAQRADGQFEKQVAIKILKRGTNTEEVLRRFGAERQILANLDHTNITRLLDAGVTRDGLPYVVMEFVDGEPITSYAQKENCSIRQRLELFFKVCSAVESAHKKGVIHRDIKPSNVLVKSDGEVKLLDFGIAKVASGQPDDVTVVAERRLTPKYAAPEQRTSHSPTIASDIYSLGVLLSELLELRNSSREDTDGSLRGCVRNVVTKATQAEPGKRYPSAAALAESAQECLSHSRGLIVSGLFGRRRASLATAAAMMLLAVVAASFFWPKATSIIRGSSSANFGAPLPSKSSEIRSIAILPFVPLPHDNNDLLGLGMADAVIGRLSGLKQLIVLPTAAVSRFRGASEDPISAGNKLNVDAVLSGTVQRAADRIRVTVQLANVSSRRTLWADSFDQTSTDIFAIQDSISEKVARSLAVNLTEADRQQLEKHYTGDTAAYESYLLGVSAYNLRTKEGLQKAIAYFEQAVASDPHYALAYALMSDCYFLQGYYSYESSEVTISKARAAAEKALSLDSSLAEAHLAMSTLERRDSPDAPGVKSVLRAISLNPNYALAHQRYAWFLCCSGQLEQALQEMKKAQALDPLSSTNNTALGIMLLFARRYPEGLHYCELAAELNQNEPYIQGNLAYAYLLNRQYEKALMHSRKVEEIDPSMHGETVAQIATILVHAGRTQEADQLMPELLALAEAKKVDPYNMTLLYAARGDSEKALHWFGQSESKAVNSPGLLRYDPQLDPIRSESRFQTLVRQHELAMSGAN